MGEETRIEENRREDHIIYHKRRQEKIISEKGRAKRRRDAKRRYSQIKQIRAYNKIKDHIREEKRREANQRDDQRI